MGDVGDPIGDKQPNLMPTCFGPLALRRNFHKTKQASFPPLRLCHASYFTFTVHCMAAKAITTKTIERIQMKITGFRFLFINNNKKKGKMSNPKLKVAKETWTF